MNPMDVIVVGGGIGGLTAAVALRKAGHRVTVLERSQSLTTFGSAVSLGPSAVKVLNHVGFDWTAAGAVTATAGKFYRSDTLDFVFEINVSEMVQRYGFVNHFLRRVDLAQELMQMATKSEDDGEGVAVQVVYDAEVVSYDPEQGCVKVKNGQTYHGDLVIASDGIYSIAPSYIIGPNLPPLRTRTAIVRFMLPTDSIKTNPRTSSLVPQDGQFSFYFGGDPSCWLLQYPAHNNEFQNFAVYRVSETEEDIEFRSKHYQISKESLRQELAGFHDSIVGLVDIATNILPFWKAADGQPLNTWHKNRLLLIGDAAHPMLPNWGFGAVSAIEDCGALSVIFDTTGGNPSSLTSPDQLQTRLELFETVRRNRASAVQTFSTVAFHENPAELKREQLLKYLSEEELPKTRPDVQHFLGGYDVLEHSREVLEQYLGSENGV